jgi:NTE family protein
MIDIDLVIEGGGIKGVLFAGAVEVLEAAGLRPVRLAGTSAGAIVAALLAAGYTAAELRAILLDLDFSIFLDGGWYRHARLWPRGGLHPGRKFRAWLGDLLAAKGIRRFGEIRYFDGPEGRDCPLQVVASDVTRGRMAVLPWDLEEYGLLPHWFGVADAVRASMSIPYLFDPVELPSPDGSSTLVDGGLLSNYPIGLFDDHPRPTIGLRSVGPGDPGTIRHPVRWWNRPADLLRAMAYTATEFHDARHVRDETWVRTILLPNLGVSPIAFGLDRPAKEALYESGRSAARAFLDRGGLDAAARMANPSGNASNI